MKELRLSLKKECFEMTKAGIKTEDYREINEYWIKRLTSDFSWDMEKYPLKLNEHKEVLNKGSMKPKVFDCNTMTLGYPKNGYTQRIIQYEHAGIEIRTGNPEWGAEPNKLYFVIKHGKRLSKRKELKTYINDTVEAYIANTYKEHERKSGSMEYFEIGKWGFYVDYEHRGARDNGSLIDLEIEIREVWSSKQEVFPRVRDLLNK